ncbi:hypothetical protein PROQFM164_S05g000111 [Penicillium roqueforti FM164]|uniref:Uncharacterized protein n=1 Tax=Penicillium roqueforti (strain FM164) TaxID=1365484 RepID=W6QHL7_PENRF|nr:hypothetical protein PROQFM164_S05g000111 [Penicillium roqueforti FM164]
MHAPEMGIFVIMAPIYKLYLPENRGSIYYPSTIANIFANRSVSRLNIFTLLMVCFGVSKADTEDYPTELPDSLPLGNIETQPGKIYPPNIQGQPSSPPDMRLHYGGVSIQGEDPMRLSGGLSASPHGEASDPAPPKGNVTKVLSIEYPGALALSEANLRVVVESQGKQIKGWYKYEKIGKSNGIRKALEEFGPTWR